MLKVKVISFHRKRSQARMYVNPLFDTKGFWDCYERSARRRVFRRVLDGENRIRAGTRLYHGTGNHDLVFEKGRQTFFGLDPVLAMWYTLEEAEKKESRGEVVQECSYVYEYEVVEPIPIDRYVDRIREHAPARGVYVHPQVALRGYNNYHALMGPFDPSIEITLMEKEGIRLVQKYFIHVPTLRKYTFYPRLVVFRSQHEIRFFLPGERYPLRNKMFLHGK
jgi:hypothetical protein